MIEIQLILGFGRLWSVFSGALSTARNWPEVKAKRAARERCPFAVPGTMEGRTMQPQFKEQTKTKSIPLDNGDATPCAHTYRVGNINFIVTPIYQSGRGETMSAILLKLMNTEVEQKE